MTIEDWERMKATGRRWAYWGSMLDATAAAGSPIVRIIRWFKSGVLAQFADGHRETVHPEYLKLACAR